MKVVAVNGGVNVAGRRPRCNSYIGVNGNTEPICVQEVEYSNRRGKSGISGKEIHGIPPMMPGVRVTFISDSSKIDKVAVQARYMRYISKQQRYITRTRSKGKW